MSHKRHVLLPVEQARPIMDALTAAGRADLAREVNVARRMDQPDEESAREDAAYIVQTARETQLTEEEATSLVTIALLIAAGKLGPVPAEERLGELFTTARLRKEARP
jgi:hypothetical protein